MPVPVNEKINIARLVIFGDSLSDSGNMAKRRLFGLFPIPGVGLNKSGDGRFADGLVWPGFFALYWVKRILKQNIKNESTRKKVWDKFVSGLIKPENEVDILHHHLIRNYAEGGATAATYKVCESLKQDINDLTSESLKKLLESVEYDVEHPDKLVSDIKQSIENIGVGVKDLGAQAIVINLAIERHRFLENEEKILQSKTKEEAQKLKDETLINVWSGANDLITVNSTPTKNEVDKAVDAIINHIKILEEQGYSNFTLFNLPDLTLTPYYQKQKKAGEISGKKLNEIRKVIKYYNTMLTKKCENLSSKPMVFDVYTKFNDVYKNPKKYGFDPKQLTTPLSDTDFKPKPGIEPAADTGAEFYNDVHPVSKLQKAIFDNFIKQLLKKFNLNKHLETFTKVCEDENKEYSNFWSDVFNFITSAVSSFFTNIWKGITSCFKSSQSGNNAENTPLIIEPSSSYSQITQDTGGSVELGNKVSTNPTNTNNSHPEGRTNQSKFFQTTTVSQCENQFPDPFSPSYN